MSSDLHMHVASLQIQDRMRAASTARLAKEAKRAAGPRISLWSWPASMTFGPNTGGSSTRWSSRTRWATRGR